MSTHCGWDGKAKEICQWFPNDPIMRSGLYNNSLLIGIWVDSFTWKLATCTLRIVVARTVWFYICCTSCLVFDIMRHLWQRGLISWWWLCMRFSIGWLFVLLSSCFLNTPIYLCCAPQLWLVVPTWWRWFRQYQKWSRQWSPKRLLITSYQQTWSPCSIIVNENKVFLL